jgi:hypothetical protein
MVHKCFFVGTGLLLWGTSSGVFEGFQIAISGSSPTKVSLQIFGPGSGWNQYDLGFDASQVFPLFSFFFFSSFLLFFFSSFLLFFFSSFSIQKAAASFQSRFYLLLFYFCFCSIINTTFLFS